MITTKTYFCTKCGAESAEQLSFCLACGYFSTYAPMIYLREHPLGAIKHKTAEQLIGSKIPYRELWGLGLIPCNDRISCCVYGQAGAGKSYFMLRCADDISKHGESVAFISAEEGFGETLIKKLRDLEITSAGISIIENTNVENVISFCHEQKIHWCFLDSYSASQWNLIDLSSLRKNGIACIFSMHITKDGDMAGEKAIEHAVDLVINIEQGKFKAEKNRYGILFEGEIFYGKQ